MTGKTGAVLLDTRSIQKYVFGCNKLKTNTGASYLVADIFDGTMTDVLKEFNFANPVTEWKDKQELKMQSDSSVDCEIAYIGGGNMLLLVRKGDTEEEILQQCRSIVSAWTEKLLVKAPGLKTGAAVGMMDLDKEKFKESLDDMYRQLKANQNNIIPETDLPYTGLTLECDYTGRTADVYSPEEGRWVAAEVEAKIRAFEEASQAMHDKYSDVLGSEYDFCSDIEKIGFKDGESYISIIHIDGNNMGVKFSACRDMQERKNLSVKVADMVEKSFRHLTKSIINEYESYDEVLDMKALSRGSRKILPIRPIIIGGDDITFICPGRMGLVYADRFIRYINSEKLLDDDFYGYLCKEKKKNGKEISQKLSCCAGVAIVPAKYPFFRAYELAEQLCSAAKQKSREDDGCYLDYAILHGEISAELEQLRRQQYEAPEGGLHYGPYNVTDETAGGHYLHKLFALAAKLGSKNIAFTEIEEKYGNKKMPANKVKELRDVLHEDMHSIEIFLENCGEMRDLLEHMTGKEHVSAEDFWEKDGEDIRTRFMDAIEIMDFMYPAKEA